MDGSSPITVLKGIGEKSALLYKKLGIMTIYDLLEYLPKDYECFDAPKHINELINGCLCSVAGVILNTPTIKKVRNLSIIQVKVSDQTGRLDLTYFNTPYIAKILKPGMHLIFRGIVTIKGISTVMEHPRYYTPAEYESLRGLLQPRYALTKGLTHQAIRKAVSQAASEMNWEKEYYPGRLLSQNPMLSRKEAVCCLHFPQSREDVMNARKRLVFDEFFDFLYLLRKNKEHITEIQNHFPMQEKGSTIRYLQSLPFELTTGQKKAWQEIREDLSGHYCMNRLIQGDVGSGKTVIAMLSLLETASNGFQGALMAPTEVLAMQHYEGIMKDTNTYELGLKPVLLVGSMTSKEKKLAYQQIKDGEVNLIIGTHALIQEKVEYKNLALVVTDEQHRFGVKQREMLSQKGDMPHVLVMSATPIPRTLAIILYGDLQISLIKELPADRLPIKNCVVGTSFRPKAYEFIAQQVELGHQAYVICPQLEPGELDDLENVVDYAKKLQSVLPPSVRVEYLHGKMKPSEKNRIMEEFASGQINILVSTTVIEVGINVPNATVMMVENAERFGLAQLHQLRGRVGRGKAQSYCIFISTNESQETMQRLEILNHSNDGFHIAAEDLRLRGPGDLFGIRQSGEFSFKIGDIYGDAEILKAASEAVDHILNRDYTLSASETELLNSHFKLIASRTDISRTI